MSLFTSEIQKHHTEPNPDLAQLARLSHPGQAHFAGTGPQGKTCRECVHWNAPRSYFDYYSKGSKHGQVLKPQKCAKYFRLMNGSFGDNVPHEAPSCKYFEQSEINPSIQKRSHD